ncbi:balbiani ring protein 3-like isoform X5 [Biomphalaria pfeifferi]|uniref:Balbiani ring protein 3-like isoform X5 n=1 Tax=Biomphalaria pfeifferi TaxID=112525 RepID=A0AAD8FD67_BIOPF|nr:balbiani ring protein 3-like isoform X5 [Biomphalaria pfeifferi]
MLLVQLATSFALIWTCQAGVASHEPQTLQTALNLFDWLSGVSSNAVISKSVDVKYHDRAVTKCPPNVMFVLDGSDSVSPIGFTYSKSALVREIRSVTQIFSDVHIGVILFGSVTEEIPIVPRTPKEIESLVDQVNKLNQPRTTTAFSSALRRARTLLLAHSNTTTAYNGDQEGNIIVILSDGKTNSQNNYDIKRATIQEAKMAQNAEMLIISLSPEEADLQFLQEISQVVQEHRTAIFWSYLVACPARVIPSVSKDSGCRDLMFVVDLSDSMIKQKEIVRQYLAYIALRYRHVTNAIGVVMYSSDPRVQFNDTRIELMEDKYALANKIRSNLKFPSTGGITSDKVILESINILDIDARSGANTLVFLTDGPPLDIQATRQAFQSAQLRGYSVLIIRVGTSLSDTDLNQMTSGLTGDVYSVNNFTELYPLDLERSTCQTGNCMSISTECRSPLKFDKTTCTCVCPTECPNNKIHNANCSCVCPTKCPTGTVQDINCNCVCTNTCPLGKQQDAYCNCGCPNICQNGRALDSNCNCVCPSTCSSGKLQDINCNCLCPNTCLSGKVQDANCNCVCPYTCPSGKLQNANCNCVCPNTCFSGKLHDFNCNCVCPNTCSSGKLQDANCNCVCPNTCPSGKLQDVNCNCVCPNTCTSGKLQDVNCNCVCPNTCTSGKLQDSNCNCVCPNTCPLGKLQDANCNCICPNTCPSGKLQDANCNCVCPNACEVGKIQDTNCNCVCPSVCPTDKNIDSQCNCVCSKICPSGQVLSNSCQCKCIDTQQSPHERCGCVPVCQDPYVYNYNTCSCEFPSKVCSQSEYSCENNQVAYRNSDDQCVCSCSSGFAGPRCDIVLKSDLCDNCYYDNGNYYAGLPGHCDMYVNCIPNGNYSNQSRPTSFTPRVMSCPPGTYYITRPDGWKGCDFLTNGVCFADLCRTLPPFAKYSDPTACQIFWQCTVDKVVPSKGCCEAGQAFDEKRQTCVTNKTCSDTCSLTENSYNFCPYDVTPYNPNEFFYKSVLWAKLKCLPGFMMDLSVCRCVSMHYPSRVAGCEPTVDIDFESSTDNEEDRVPRVIVPAVGRVGNFSGNQDLTLKMFAGSGFYTNYFQINLKLYLPNVPTESQRMAVVTNADCNKRESVSITLNNKNLYFKIYQSELDQAAEVSLPYSGAADGNGWYRITLIYKKVDSNVFELTGQVGNITQTYGGSLRAYIATRNCALHLGYGFNYTSLVGYTDNFQVWRCNPNNNLE